MGFSTDITMILVVFRLGRFAIKLPNVGPSFLGKGGYKNTINGEWEISP